MTLSSLLKSLIRRLNAVRKIYKLSRLFPQFTNLNYFVFTIRMLNIIITHRQHRAYLLDKPRTFRSNDTQFLKQLGLLCITVFTSVTLHPSCTRNSELGIINWKG